MIDRPALNDEKREVRMLLVKFAREMLAGELSFVEGAAAVVRLRGRVGGVGEFDEDFMSFVTIGSEADHLPLRAQWPVWDQAALERLAPEFERVQDWASTFAPAVCENLIGRFNA